jgi:hypothetical protein
VHFTGMLVIRSRLSLDPPKNRGRLKRLIAMAPVPHFGESVCGQSRGSGVASGVGSGTVSGDARQVEHVFM